MGLLDGGGNPKNPHMHAYTPRTCFTTLGFMPFALMPLASLHHSLICTLSQRPLADLFAFT
jgi:hypothetical protein